MRFTNYHPSKSVILSLFFLLSLSIHVFAQDELPKVISGELIRIKNFSSDYITPRNIDIWLPDGDAGASGYSVLYMHDGQMLFDAERTWNQQAWDIDNVASKMMQTDSIRKFIIVGIWNSDSTRHSDYFPQKPFEGLSDFAKDTISSQLQRSGRTQGYFKPQSDNYLKFLVEELKPYIDKTYSVAGDTEHTFLMGSSMGGLVSIYALCEYPEIFGGAACLSTHWPGTFTLEHNPAPVAFLQYLKTNLPEPGKHKIYFDHGDQTLDSLYPDIQKEVDNLMLSKGYDEHNWNTLFFPGENHSEDAWNRRVRIPLEFLFED